MAVTRTKTLKSVLRGSNKPVKKAKGKTAPAKRSRKVESKRLLWDGPESDSRNGGVTQTLMNSFDACRERCRLLLVEGYKERDEFRVALEYGSMWHICEEHYDVKNKQHHLAELKRYADELGRKYRMDRADIKHWAEVCRLEFDEYVKYWKKKKWSEHGYRWKTREQVFSVPYCLPSGRTVILRGMWDGVLIKGRSSIKLRENKTKYEINEMNIANQLMFDRQTMLYIIALQEHLGPKFAVKEISYNVVVRPLSGGQYSIRPHKKTKNQPAEPMSQFYDRLRGLIASDGDFFFKRWEVDITPDDIERYKLEYLHPTLEQMCQWWDWVSSPNGLKDPFSEPNGIHRRLPYGSYNPVGAGKRSVYDEYLNTGSTMELRSVDTIFNELDGDN